jgi:hypothetical protein
MYKVLLVLIPVGRVIEKVRGDAKLNFLLRRFTASKPPIP